MLRKKKTTRNNTTVKLICGIILIALALYAFMAYFGMADNYAGADFNTLQHYLFGMGAFFFPVLLLIWGIKLSIAAENTYLTNKKCALMVVVFALLLATVHNVIVPGNQELYPEQLPAGGGLTGGMIVLLLHRVLGSTGTWAALLLVWAVVLYMAIPWRFLSDRLFPKADDGLNEENAYSRSLRTRAPAAKNVAPPVFQSSAAQKNVYNQEEFSSFTDGINEKHAFKRILGFKKSVYKDKKVHEAIEANPVELPDWEVAKKTVVVRPIIDYEAKAQDVTVREINQSEPVKNVIVHNPYREHQNASEVKPDEAPMLQEQWPKQEHQAPNIAIYDSAEKQYQKAEDKTGSCQEQSAASDNGQENGSYQYPTINLLDLPQIVDPISYESDIMHQCSVLEQTLADFKVKAKVVAVTRGPSVTRFELEPAPGVKVSSVVNLADDIALKLAASGVRIEAPIPGKAAIGIEVPNIKNDPVYFMEVVQNERVQQADSKLCIGLGKDISGNIITADLAKMPHLLVAGSTGSGKSVCINTIIAGLLYKARPDEVKLILVDPKVVELSNYNGIPHLLTPVVTDAKKAASALHWAVAEMERRYKLFAESHVREINSYNRQAQEKMPFIVIIIDELSDLMMVAKVDVEDAILRLAQKARAAGIHLILATQRPSVDVITGIVKANIPSRIAFAVSSQTDSRTILDMGGAEKLLGKGDMLFYPIGYNKPVRVQGAFVSDAELNRIVDFIVKQSIPVNYSEEVTTQALECENKNNAGDSSGGIGMYEDDLFESAVQLVMDMGQASSSMLQRRFRIGYTRAARLVDMMEELGIVGQSAGSKPREVILSRQEIEERFLKHE